MADPLHLTIPELCRDFLHGVDLVLERDELTADVEQLALDLLGVVPLQGFGAEDPGLDLLDRALELTGPVEAVIDQGVEDAPHEFSEGRGLALFEADEHRIDRPGRAGFVRLAERGHPALADEQVDRAEVA